MPRPPPPASIVPLEDGWAKVKNEGIRVLEEYLDAGHTQKPQSANSKKPQRNVFNKSNYADLYTTVYNMCAQRKPNNWSEQVYLRYGEAMADYVRRQVRPALAGKTDTLLMRELLRRWSNHKIYVKWMDRFFTYLDRYYVKLRSLEPLHNRGYMIFSQVAFEDVKRDTRQALLQTITRERRGEQIEQDLVKGVVDMLIDLGLGSLNAYNTEFEEAFLPETADYYDHQAAGWLSEDSFAEYLRKAEDAIHSEELRVTNYLHRSTQPKLKLAVIQSLIAVPQAQLLDKDTAVVYLLENDKREDLARMHRMFSLIDNGLAPIAQTFRSYVTGRGSKIVDERIEQAKAMASKTDALGDPSFIQTLLGLHDNFKGIVSECFGQDSLFQRSLKEAFEVLVNRDMGKYSFAALMSSFCDRILRRSGERLPDDQVEFLLTKMVELFSFLSDKDLFAEIYRNQLSKRLIHETSASEDAEKSMIAKLKLRCGAQFTYRLEGMITDLSLASELQRDFREHCEQLPEGKSSLGGIDFGVTVLTTGFWPSYQVQEANLCPEMHKAIQVFHSFYNGRTQHRRLQWIHSLGQATVAARLNGCRHDLIVNTYQALILLLFARDETHNLSFVQNATGLDAAHAKRLLATLATSKYRILSKSGDPKSVEDDATFTPNDGFECPHRKIRIPPPVSEEAQNRERVEEDRSIAIGAAIVRVMKMRKLLSHQQLVSEVLAQLAFFKPSPRLIKQRIENLIEREYLERDPDEASMYRYVA
uniref:Cullin family profile domain-containing protein n=1 Tax=Alexandrium monilatum TaxID=311494 RepID=A0A7S4V257_9DINO